MRQAAKTMESKKHLKTVRIPRKVLAFQQVAARGERRLIEWFAKEQVNVDSKDNNRNTALMLAAANGRDGAVGKLLELGADPNAANRFGHTSLMMAAGNGHMGAVRILLGHRAKAYLKDDEGKTASQYARENGHYEVGKIIEMSQESLNEGAIDALRRGSAGEFEYYLCLGADPASLGPALNL